MKLYAITDNPQAHTGLALAEISAQPAHTPGELLQALENIPKGDALIIITEGLAQKGPEIIKDYRAKNPKALITIF